MMKSHRLYSLLTFFATLIMTACSTEISESQQGGIVSHTCRMYFNGNVGQYEPISRASTVELTNGMTLYINFGNNITGTAVYDKSAKEWSISYLGSLPIGTFPCSMCYVENVGNVVDNAITLSTGTAIYNTLDGTYSVIEDGSIVVTGTLKPLLSRVRFKGDSGVKLTISGMKTVTKFNIADYTYTTSSSDQNAEIQSNGYTPYIHYIGPASDSLEITIGDRTYKTGNILQTGGLSSYCTVPTLSDHQGWRTEGDVGINGHEYVDLGIGVKWATCNIGATNCYDKGSKFQWGTTDNWTTILNIGSSMGWGYYYKYIPFNRRQEKDAENYITKYNSTDGKTTLELDDDAAYQQWGSTWRTPTYDEISALKNNCLWTWYAEGNTEFNGVAGYKVQSKKNGYTDRYIFLPEGDEYWSSYGYWSSSLKSTPTAYYLKVRSNNNSILTDYRYNVYMVRPVTK